MKQSKLMKERIFRSGVLFKELGYDVFEGTVIEDSYSAGFEKDGEFAGGYFIDRDSKFLEIAYSFSFSSALSVFVQTRLNDMLKTCYEFGCYMNIQKDDDLSFSIFSKIYFAGLNFYSLKETLKDFNGCIQAVKEVIEITNHAGGSDENT